MFSRRNRALKQAKKPLVEADFSARENFGAGIDMNLLCCLVVLTIFYETFVEPTPPHITRERITHPC